MALNAAVVFEVRTGGADTNGGGFKTGATGTDYSQQDAAQVAIDGATITCTVNATTTKLDISGYTTAATDVGNIVQISGGTMTAGFYEITAQTGGTQWTVDRAAGTAAQTGTGNMGGALASPGKAAAAATVAGHTVWVKSGTYDFTTATPGAAGPVVLAARVVMEGYQTTRGDRTGTMPVISWAAVSAPGAQTFICSNGTAAGAIFKNITADGNSVANVSGFKVNGGAGVLVTECIAQHCDQATQVGFLGALSTFVYRCLADDCTTGFVTIQAVNCVAASCGTGFTGNAFNCIAYSCTTDNFKPAGGSTGIFMTNCVAYGGTADGFDGTASAGVTFIDCVAVNNGGYGYNTAVSNYIINSVDYNNTSGRRNAAPHFDDDPITLTGNPFDGGGSADFRPNNTASQGAALRDTALGVYGQTDNRDIGAVQHADPAGGGGRGLIFGG